MGEQLTFHHVKDPARHALTKAGYKTIQSAGRLIVYCTEDGPLDPQYTAEWIRWREQREADAHRPA